MHTIEFTDVELAALANRTPHVYNHLSPDAVAYVRHLTAAPDAMAWFSAQDKLVAAMEAAAENTNPATVALRHHVTGAVERGEAEPITEVRDA